MLNREEACRILGVQWGSSLEQIKQAFRYQAKIHHPDMGGNAEKFKQVKEAYEYLRTASVLQGKKLPLTHSKTSIFRVVRNK